MGPKQLSGVMDIVARNAAAGRGVPVDEEQLAAQAAMLEGMIEQQSTALFATGRLWDDGIIHPNDSRTVLGLALSAVHSAPVQGSTEYGVWRH
jgi:acetyl-CoA carboxylase carboxyltransferase component